MVLFTSDTRRGSMKMHAAVVHAPSEKGPGGNYADFRFDAARAMRLRRVSVSPLAVAMVERSSLPQSRCIKRSRERAFNQLQAISGEPFIASRISKTGGYKVLYTFKGGSDGAYPHAALVAFKGLLYSTTVWGGTGSACGGGIGCAPCSAPAQRRRTRSLQLQRGIRRQNPDTGWLSTRERSMASLTVGARPRRWQDGFCYQRKRERTRAPQLRQRF